LIHIQWNGANTNPQGNAGEGPAGFDRSTLLVMRHNLFYKAGQEYNTFNNIGHWSETYPEPFTPTTGPRFLGFSYEDCWRMATPAQYSGYFDLGLRQVGGTAPTAYHVVSTRNNNFTNRSQKGKVVVYQNTTSYETVSNQTLSEIVGSDNIGWASMSYSVDPRREGEWNIRLSDAGASSGVTHTVLVEPMYISIQDGAKLWLNIDYQWVPFAYGRIFYQVNKTDTAIEIYTNVQSWSSNGNGKATALISVGGYYHVNNVVNGSAVGGVAIGALVVILLTAWLIKRFRCRCFNKADPADTAAQKESLLPTSTGPTSDTAAAPMAAAVPATTSGV